MEERASGQSLGGKKATRRRSGERSCGLWYWGKGSLHSWVWDSTDTQHQPEKASGSQVDPFTHYAKVPQAAFCALLLGGVR